MKIKKAADDDDDAAALKYNDLRFSDFTSGWFFSHSLADVRVKNYFCIKFSPSFVNKSTLMNGCVLCAFLFASHNR
jgi:hypothetical protein